MPAALGLGGGAACQLTDACRAGAHERVALPLSSPKPANHLMLTAALFLLQCQPSALSSAATSTDQSQDPRICSYAPVTNPSLGTTFCKVLLSTPLPAAGDLHPALLAESGPQTPPDLRVPQPGHMPPEPAGPGSCIAHQPGQGPSGTGPSRQVKQPYQRHDLVSTRACTPGQRLPAPASAGHWLHTSCCICCST